MVEFNNFDQHTNWPGLSGTDLGTWSYGEVKKPETINYRTLEAGTGRAVLRTHFWADQRLGMPLR